MQYRILGPLAVLDDDGDELVLGGPRERLVLGMLLLNANRVVSTDRLIEALWGEYPPATASNALQVHISKLRKLLHTAPGSEGPIRTQLPGYTLKTVEGELDAEQFERLATDSGTDEVPASVVVRLTQALALWRGSVLEGMEAETFGRTDVSRLMELRMAAVERRIEAELALGRHREVVGELEGLAGEHPLRESLQGQLMVALYRSGRQADALSAYGRSRAYLADELGIDPSPELQALELAILNQSPDLNLPRGAAVSAPEPPEMVVGGVQADRLAIPLPPRLATAPSMGVVGREGELQVIADAYKRVAQADGCEVVLIAGEAGLGKTTLVAEAARSAFGQGANVLFGHCEEGLAAPYQFFVEALGHLVAHLPDDDLLAHVRAYGPELSHLLPALPARLSDLPASSTTDSDTERYLLFGASVGLIADASKHRPLVLVLDDLQWADRGSLLLLRHLAGSESVPQLLILATYRDNELLQADGLRDTLGVLRRNRGVQRIDLAGLDDRDVVSYFEAASGQALDDEGVGLAHAVYRETDGNPFFVGEILRHLTETGAIYRNTEGRWVAGEVLAQTVLPDSVREVIGGRVERLGKDAEVVLSLAAVIGRDFDLDLLALAAGRPEDAVLDLLEGAAGAALVTELTGTSGRFQFTHALIQATLYQHLGPTRRARAHRQVAEALEELSARRPASRVGELARHWVAAIQPIDLTKAVDYSRQAGDEALAALAPGDALRYYSQALELSAQGLEPDPLLELDATIGLGTAMRQTGDPAFRETLLRGSRQAAALGDTDRLVAAALGNSRGTLSTVGVVDEEKVAILETALGWLGDQDERRALVLATLSTELTVGTSLERRQQLAEEALSIAERSGNDTTIVRVLNQVLLPLAVPHLLATSIERSQEALERSEVIGDPGLLCTAASGRRLFAAAAGDIEEMDRCFEMKRPLVERLDFPFLRWVHTLQSATRAVIDGDPGEAEDLALRALQIGTDSGQPDGAIVYGTQLIMVHLLRGTMGTLVPLIEQAIADNPALPVFGAVLALAHADSGRLEEARAQLEGFARTDFRMPLDVTWLTGMIACAEATSACGDRRFAGPLFEQLEPFGDQWLYTDLAASGPVSRSLGELLVLLGRYDEAESQFALAAASSEKAGARFFCAQTDLSWGRMLMERNDSGDSERARSLLARARHSAAVMGYGTVERRATTSLDAADG